MDYVGVRLAVGERTDTVHLSHVRVPMWNCQGREMVAYAVARRAACAHTE